MIQMITGLHGAIRAAQDHRPGRLTFQGDIRCATDGNQREHFVHDFENAHFFAKWEGLDCAFFLQAVITQRRAVYHSMQPSRAPFTLAGSNHAKRWPSQLVSLVRPKDAVAALRLGVLSRNAHGESPKRCNRSASQFDPTAAASTTGVSAKWARNAPNIRSSRRVGSGQPNARLNKSIPL